MPVATHKLKTNNEGTYIRGYIHFDSSPKNVMAMGLLLEIWLVTFSNPFSNITSHFSNIMTCIFKHQNYQIEFVILSNIMKHVT